MGLKFYEIGKANAEIDRLMAEGAALTAENSALKETILTTVTESERLEKELAESKTQLGAMGKQLAAEQTKAAQQAESAAANLKVIQASTEQIASAKALEITQAQGIPPVVINPTEIPGKTSNAANLRGHDRVVAAIEAQLAEHQTNKKN